MSGESGDYHPYDIVILGDVHGEDRIIDEYIGDRSCGITGDVSVRYR
jgi:hypothetical protein